jgi:hypothetical protein
MAFFNDKFIEFKKNVFAKIYFNMKTIKLFLLCTCLFCASPLVDAQNSEVSTDIISALNNGDASKLSSRLNANVELVIENKNDVFSRQQAAGIIADFFRKNPVSSFQLLHKGNKDAASFAIGILKTSSGSFRVYVLTRKNEIQQLRIEPSND